MHPLKTLTAAVTFAALNLAAPFALAQAHDPDDNNAEHNSPASQAQGTRENQGLGGSVDVPHAEGGAAQTTPYEDLGTNGNDDDDDDDRTTGQDITAGDQPVSHDDGRRSDGEGENR